jgi:hypothetical protein
VAMMRKVMVFRIRLQRADDSLQRGGAKEKNFFDSTCNGAGKLQPR